MNLRILLFMLTLILVGGVFFFMFNKHVQQVKYKNRYDEKTLVERKQICGKILDSLCDIVLAKNLQEIQKDLPPGVHINNGYVNAGIVLSDESFVLDSAYGTVKDRYKNILSTELMIDKVIELSKDPKIKYISSGLQGIAQ